jgi:hypothetical protein
MIQKLTSIAALIGVVSAIGAGFVQYGKIMAKIEELDARETVINETVDLAPINEKISDLEVEILDRMSALEDEWMARDNDTNDDILNDIAGVQSEIKSLIEKVGNSDQQLQLNIVELSDKTFKEFGKVRDLINELAKKIAIAEKQSELNKILIDEIKAEASNPLGG